LTTVPPPAYHRCRSPVSPAAVTIGRLAGARFRAESGGGRRRTTRSVEYDAELASRRLHQPGTTSGSHHAWVLGDVGRALNDEPLRLCWLCWICWMSSCCITVICVVCHSILSAGHAVRCAAPAMCELLAGAALHACMRDGTCNSGAAWEVQFPRTLHYTVLPLFCPARVVVVNAIVYRFVMAPTTRRVAVPAFPPWPLRAIPPRRHITVNPSQPMGRTPVSPSDMVAEGAFRPLLPLCTMHSPSLPPQQLEEWRARRSLS